MTDREALEFFNSFFDAQKLSNLLAIYMTDSAKIDSLWRNACAKACEALEIKIRMNDDLR